MYVAGTGGEEATGGGPAVDTFRLDMNFYTSASCTGTPGYVMGASYDTDACYTGAQVKLRVKDATPRIGSRSSS